MKRAIAALLFMFAAFQSQAQRGPRPQGPPVERVRAAKVGYLTERLNLSTEQAERFWPVYNRYEAEIRLINKEGRMARRAGRNTDMTDAEIRQSLEQMREWQEARINAQKKYEPEFLKVLSARQVADLYTAEREFNAMLLKRLRDAQKRGGVDRRGGPGSRFED